MLKRCAGTEFAIRTCRSGMMTVGFLIRRALISRLLDSVPLPSQVFAPGIRGLPQCILRRAHVRRIGPADKACPNPCDSTPRHLNPAERHSQPDAFKVACHPGLRTPSTDGVCPSDVIDGLPGSRAPAIACRLIAVLTALQTTAVVSISARESLSRKVPIERGRHDASRVTSCRIRTRSCGPRGAAARPNDSAAGDLFALLARQCVARV
jgi:hypothetical protein